MDKMLANMMKALGIDAEKIEAFILAGMAAFKENRETLARLEHNQALIMSRLDISPSLLTAKTEDGNGNG